MIHELLLISIVTPLIFAQTKNYPATSAYFVNNQELVKDTYKIYWNYSQTDIIAEIHVKTNGWFGFGLSPNGGMVGSDVIVAWIDQNGKTHFTDRYITKSKEVLIDKSQDWFLLYSKKENGFTIIKFTRKVDTCDQYNQDRVIPPGTPRVIFAWNNQLPSTNGDISYHGFNNRGTLAMQLLSAFNEQLIITPEDKIETYDFNVEVTLPPIDTYYHCHIFKLPQKLIIDKRHLIRTFTNITRGNEKHVHHWTLYQCDPKLESEYLQSNSLPHPDNCYDFDYTYSQNEPNTWMTVKEYCKEINLVWAIGGQLTLDFPNGLGFPIGGSDREFTYLLLEIHYDNPEQRSDIVDKSGVQFHVTPNLRKTEIGVFTMGGTPSWPGIFIPPGQESFKFDFYCRKNCLNKFYQEKTVTIFAVFPHTHLQGIEVKTTLVRNGTEIAFVDKNEYYDFNYQFVNFLPEPIVLKPNDELKTTCVYKTTDRETYTIGGIGTRQEMIVCGNMITFFFIFCEFKCADFLYYYPRRPGMGWCTMYTDYNDWLVLIDDLVKTGAMNLSQSPPDYMSLSHDIHTIKTDSTTISKFKHFFETANETQLCGLPGEVLDSTHPRVQPKPIVELDSCRIVPSFSTRIINKLKLTILLVSLSLYSFQEL